MSAPNIINPPAGGGGGGGISGSGSSPYVAKWSGTSALTTGILVDTGISVGILTTSPVTTFQVGGNTVATPSPVGAFCTLGSNSRFTADDGTRAVTLAADGTSAIVGTTTAHDLVLQRGGVEAARIIAGGLTGFGNTNPAATVEAYAAVTGEVRASGDVVSIVSSYSYNSAAAAFAPFVRLSRSRGTRAAPAAVNALDTIGVVQWQARGTTDRAVANISCTAPANAGGDQISGQLTFATAQTTDAIPVVRITVNPAGNVGIGNTAGTILGKLHVGSGATAPVVTTPGLIVTGSASEARLVVKESSVGAEWFVLPSTTTVNMGTVNAFPLELKTTNATRVTISAAGDTSIANTLSFNSGFGSAAVAYGTRAWVNFNGTGVVAIRGSGNVSTITDLGVGSYSVNFTNAMPDVNYSAHATVGYDGAVGSGIVASVDRNSAAAAVGSVRVYLFNTTFAVADSTMVFVSVTR